jgi:hypothetical protein
VTTPHQRVLYPRQLRTQPLAFDVLFVVPLVRLLPSMRPPPASSTEVAADVLSKWGREGMGEFPGVDESRDRLHRAGWSVGESASATR